MTALQVLVFAVVVLGAIPVVSASEGGFCPECPESLYTARVKLVGHALDGREAADGFLLAVLANPSEGCEAGREVAAYLSGPYAMSVKGTAVWAADSTGLPADFGFLDLESGITQLPECP